MKRIEKEELREMATEVYGLEHFCGLNSDKLRLFLTDSDFTKNFTRKNHVQGCVDLTKLTFPNGLNSRDDKRAFLGLAVGARAIAQVGQAGSSLTSVVVHCKEGKERTPSVVVYYLIRYHGLDGKAAIQLVRDALSLRERGDLFETSSSLPHYYRWLGVQTEQTLKEYEIHTLAKKEPEAEKLALAALEELCHVTENKKQNIVVLQVKEPKFLNQALKFIKQVAKESVQSDVPAQEKKDVALSDKKAEDLVKSEKKSEPHKTASSHAKIMGALSKRRSARLNTEPGEAKALFGSYKGALSEKIRYQSPPTKGKQKQASSEQVQSAPAAQSEASSPRASEEEHGTLSTRPGFKK